MTEEVEVVTSVDRTGDTATVRLHGEVDVMVVDQVRVAMTDALAAGPRSVVIDLSDLSFIDSTGLGALIFGFQRARDSGVAFKLAGPTSGVRKILVLSGLLEVVDLED